MVGQGSRRGLRRMVVVVGVLLGGLASGTMLGAGALVAAQWAFSSVPLLAEPAEAAGTIVPNRPG